MDKALPGVGIAKAKLTSGVSADGEGLLG